MKRVTALALVLTLMGVVPAQAQTSPTGKSAKKSAAASNSAVAQQLSELKQALDAQQQQIKQLSDQIQSRDQQIQQLQQSLQQSQTATTQAQSKADEAASQSAKQDETVNSLASDVKDLKQNSTNTAVALQETQTGLKKAVESPVAIHYKGITLTPGGFADASTVWRQRAASADINTPFTGIPYTANTLSRVGELNMSGRHSRLSLLGESKIGNVKLTGYWEADFLGTGVTSNNRQSNSYVMRQRVIFGQAAFANGLSLTGGQMWSLVTENKKGIQNRTELPPLTIDPQYNVGFSWARQYAFRVAKDFGGKFALAAAIEGPQATVGGRGFSNLATNTAGITTTTAGNTVLNAIGAGGGLLNFADTSGYTINKAPDFIVKAAIDPGWGHYEIIGLVSAFRNRIYPCAVAGTNATDTVVPSAILAINCPITGTPVSSAAGAYNDTRTGGGVGVNFRLPIYAKKLELAFQGMAGDGVGRYGSAQIPDLTFRPDGTAALIRTAHGLAGLEYHSTKWDLYAYGGEEYGARTAYTGYNSIAVTKTPAITFVPNGSTGPTCPVPAANGTCLIPATTSTKISTTGIGGYGSTFANNSGCQTELIPSNSLGQFPPPSSPFTPSSGSNCAGDVRVIFEGTVGFWHKIYQGDKGGFRWGIQYSYFAKNGWSGNNNVAGAAGFAPKAIDNMIWTSIRYYIP
ncbi:MAG TPA: hypothetical protein VN708_13535 [Terriglobales bacterium]|nr:hypothetical protein [Terriglobales bacterium]